VSAIAEIRFLVRVAGTSQDQFQRCGSRSSRFRVWNPLFRCGVEGSGASWYRDGVPVLIDTTTCDVGRLRLRVVDDRNFRVPVLKIDELGLACIDSAVVGAVKRGGELMLE